MQCLGPDDSPFANPAVSTEHPNRGLGSDKQHGTLSLRGKSTPCWLRKASPNYEDVV